MPIICPVSHFVILKINDLFSLLESCSSYISIIVARTHISQWWWPFFLFIFEREWPFMVRHFGKRSNGVCLEIEMHGEHWGNGLAIMETSGIAWWTHFSMGLNKESHTFLSTFPSPGFHWCFLHISLGVFFIDIPFVISCEIVGAVSHSGCPHLVFFSGNYGSTLCGHLMDFTIFHRTYYRIRTERHHLTLRIGPLEVWLSQ